MLANSITRSKTSNNITCLPRLPCWSVLPRRKLELNSSFFLPFRQLTYRQQGRYIFRQACS